MLHIVSMWAEKILTRLHLCIVSSEPSLVTYAPYCLYMSREDSDENALMRGLLLLIVVGHLCSILFVCEQWGFWRECTCAETPLTLRWLLRLNFVCMWAVPILHLCTDSTESSLVTYAPFCMFLSREDSDETAFVHSLVWAFAGSLCSILCVCGQRRFWRDCTCAVSSEPSLVTYASYFCGCEQGRLWRDFTCAQSPLSLLWSLMLNIFVYVSRGDSDETTLVHRLV